MEGIGELTSFKTVNELKCELADAYKTIAEKEVEFQKVLEENHRLVEKITLLEKRLLQSEGDDDREAKVKPSLIPERKAEEIIPKECWAVIFRKLNAEDLLSCRRVCKTFKQIMDFKEFSVKWKFHLVLPQLFPYLKTSHPDGDPSWEHLYKSRLACRSWRHSIDQYVSKVYGSRFFTFSRIREMPLVTCFRTCEDIEEFREKFGEWNGNPFPSRSVCIRPPEEDEDDEGDDDNDYRDHGRFQTKVGKLLKQFGKHIFRLRLYFENLDPLSWCQLIRSIPIRLPNLKELFIEDGTGDEYEEDEDEMEEVATYIEENALAALPKLQALSVISGLGKKVAVANYLLEAFGPQLIQLETPFSDKFQMRELKNLRKLWLEVDKHQSLESLRLLQAPLKYLKLTFEGSAQETWYMDKLLSYLRHLQVKLLDIHMWNLDRVNLTESGIDLEEYKNASIITLIIHIDQPEPDSDDDHQISFNFLPALTMLENLELKFSGEQFHTTHPGELPEVVKLNEYLFGKGGTDLPYQSNVWEKVPTLKTLKLGFADNEDEDFVYSLFTREEYERFRIIPEWFLKA